MTTAGSRDFRQDFQVVELRRYTMVEGGREAFARYFESYFPEAFQQLGALMLGNFFERRNALVFSWLRGFKDLDARGAVCGALRRSRLPPAACCAGSRSW